MVDERLKVYGVEGLMVAGAFFFHPSTIRTSIFVSCISFPYSRHVYLPGQCISGKKHFCGFFSVSSRVE